MRAKSRGGNGRQIKQTESNLLIWHEYWLTQKEGKICADDSGITN